MSTHKHIDRLCAAAMVLCLLLAITFMNGKSLGLRSAASVMGYEARLFDTDRVHTIDIVMNGWDSFLETCENEEYAQCAVVIDGEAYKNTGIRAKGNTSLNMVSAMDSDRYSFKLEFDHYESGKTYYGLDKLSLNNVIQDATYMKDYLTYQMMLAFGVDAPLCSYVYITVNGEDWGLYLAVEGVEDAFLRRNYGSSPGELYKPDNTGMGGGRGNGRAFNMEDIMNSDESANIPQVPFGGALPESFDPSALFENGAFPTLPDGFAEGRGGDRHGGFRENREGSGGPGGFGGMGSDDVKLKYTDDDPSNYSNIFQNAKTDISEADQARLISSLKALGESEDLENMVDVDEVIRYFVVHNFVCNGDSYTGSMVHNYYLYEENGQFSMIPWDYNLAYGTFQGGSASSAVNSPIDTPVSSGDSRPMLDWIFDSEEYTALYHQYFQEFLETAGISERINSTANLIAPYVEKDPTAFYTLEDFRTGVEALQTFCRLRSESIQGQLNGTIPSTSEGQAADASSLVDASSLTLSDMGTMNHGGGFGGPNGGGGFRMPGQNGGERPADSAQKPPEASSPSGQPSDVPAGRSGDSFPDVRQGRREMSGNGFPGERGGGFPGLPEAETPTADGTLLISVMVSFGVLLAGLLFAFRYRRRGC